jgi:magnesium chelatase family protein
MTTSLPVLGVAPVHGAALTGIDAQIVRVQATVSTGVPGFAIMDVPGDGTREIRDRVRAAVLNSGLAWPSGGVTVSLGPASLFGRGCGLDLPIAVAILTATGAIPARAATGHVFVAELGLDGRLRPVHGIVPILTAAAAHSERVTAVVAPQNGPEAATLPGVTVVPAESLHEVAGWLGEVRPSRAALPASGSSASGPVQQGDLGLSGLGVPTVLRQALEVSAAGGHHVCLTGPRRAGVPALAAGLVTLLPDLTGQEAAEVTALHSAAGLLGAGRARITRPPLRVPHHTATMASMAGGDIGIRPGEAALAHGGVLCLDEAPEFERAVLNVLRQPLRDHEILLARGGAIARFPARFILIASLCPCPCGADSGCACTPVRKRRYRSRVTGTIGTWIPLRLAVDRLDLTHVTGDRPGRDADAISPARVAEARDRMGHRLAGTPWRLNGDIPRHELRRTYPPAGDGLALIDHAADLGLIGSLGGRARHRGRLDAGGPGRPLLSRRRRMRPGARLLDRSGPMTATAPGDQERIARATLTNLAEPADPIVCGLLQVLSAADLVACVRSGTTPASVTGIPGGVHAARSALRHYRAQLHGVPADAGLGSFARRGIQLVCPGDPDWPAQLDDLDTARPYALWVRGTTDLQSCCQRAVSIVGSRAATAYGVHVAKEIAVSLSGQGWTIVSGAACGIDAAAHYAALVAGGTTVAVLACGVDHTYPQGHADLLADIASRGAVISEYPPGRLPARRRFLARNRVIAALTAGTVVVEAGLRSGALNAARQAREFGRPVMAVPGPVTSSQSAGCHQLIRDGHATCATCAADILTDVSPARVNDPR